jgi:hypothetical protein
MTKINHFSPAFEEGHFNGLVDEGEYLRQSSLYKQILPRTRCWLKKPRNQRNLWLINDLRLRSLTYEIINLFLHWSIRKNEPKTNPNEPKTNPILANKTPIRTQFKPKQTQSQPVQLGERATEREPDLCLSYLFDLQICPNGAQYSEIHDLIASSVMKRNYRCRRICTISHRFVELKGINHENQRSYQNFNCSDY